ncbi:MAG: amidohydrolase family protein [Deltaproteobacteria bacterium]|nr:amidohydrolase family protein [Deltaproteobacteria bacterium]
MNPVLRYKLRVPLTSFDRLILHNATVHSFDDAGTVAEAVGFAGGWVTATGSLDTVRAATPNAEERDLRGAAVYPGFIDAHHHFCFAATYAGFAEVRCPPCRSLADVLAIVRREAARVPEGEWLVLVGLNEHNLAERRTPDRDELDQAAPRHPLLLVHFTYHEGVLNSLGLRRAGLDTTRTDPPGGSMGRRRGGEPDGRVAERCFGHAEAVARQALIARDREGWFAPANAYQQRVLAAGITHVCDAAVPASMEALYREWQRRGELAVGVTMMPLAENMFAVPDPRADGVDPQWRDGRLRRGPLKLFTDGGTRCAVCITLRDAIRQFAAMLARSLRARSLTPWRLAAAQPAHLGPDRRLHTGLLYYDDEALQALVRQACGLGHGVGIHAAGNEAVAQALDALAAAHRGSRPPRIDHFFFLDAPLLRRAVDLGAHVVVQPIQLRDTGALLRETGLPPGLVYQAHRQMLDAGLHLAASSDAPVFSFDVRAAIATAVSRRDAAGGRLGADQAIGVADALRMFTRGGAATLGLAGEIGQLTPGARADAVVMSEDLLRVPVERLESVGVLATYAGRVVSAP